MTARMHLALDGAFHREHEPVVEWVDRAEAAIGASDASLLEAPGVTDLVKWLRESEARLPVIRTHGDFHLGRTARTDQGWVVSDCVAGGAVAPGPTVRLRTPLGDVADLLWSMHRASTVAAAERDPAGRLGLAALGHASGDAQPSGLRDGLPGHGRESAAWSGPTGTWCAGSCRSWSWPARCGATST